MYDGGGSGVGVRGMYASESGVPVLGGMGMGLGDGESVVPRMALVSVRGSGVVPRSGLRWAKELIACAIGQSKASAARATMAAWAATRRACRR